MKILSSQFSTTTSTSSGRQAPFVPSRVVAPHPMMVLLFGKRPPRWVDPRRYPKLRKALRKLEQIKDEAAELAGQPGNQILIGLCEGENASITQNGEVGFGVGLLQRHQGNDDLLVAILGHEIGHRPWTWSEKELPTRKKSELNQLYRDEEAKADCFAGLVVAELGADPDAICNFLVSAEKFEGRSPPDYYPAELRAAMIQEAFRRRRRIMADGRAALGALEPALRPLR